MTATHNKSTSFRRRQAAWFALSTAVLLLESGTAEATTFDDITVEELTQASDLVVVGTVEQVDVLPQGPGGQPGIHTRVQIAVEETLRGAPAPAIEVWVHGGRLGDRMRVVPGQASFRARERVALFLFRANGGYWPVGMARGKWVVDANGMARPQAPLSDRQTAPLRSVDLRARVGSAPTMRGSVHP